MLIGRHINHNGSNMTHTDKLMHHNGAFCLLKSKRSFERAMQ
jgi:hypothetical protein